LIFMDFMNILAFGFLFFMIIRRILEDKKAHFKSFRILSDKEKDYYDIKKIKIYEILLIIFVYFFYVVGVITRSTLTSYRTITCIVIIVILFLIFDRTKIIWNLFCKKTLINFSKKGLYEDY
jgi:protein-S-isoprenylcysteine O-methyltransferase Ste14